MFQKDAIPTGTSPPLLINLCSLYEHNLIWEEQVAYLGHNHTLFKDDNGLVFEILWEALMGSSMASTIWFCKKTRIEEMHLLP